MSEQKTQGKLSEAKQKQAINRVENKLKTRSVEQSRGIFRVHWSVAASLTKDKIRPVFEIAMAAQLMSSEPDIGRRLASLGVCEAKANAEPRAQARFGLDQ